MMSGLSVSIIILINHRHEVCQHMPGSAISAECEEENPQTVMFGARVHDGLHRLQRFLVQITS